MSKRNERNERLLSEERARFAVEEQARYDALLLAKKSRRSSTSEETDAAMIASAVELYARVATCTNDEERENYVLVHMQCQYAQRSERDMREMMRRARVVIASETEERTSAEKIALAKSADNHTAYVFVFDYDEDETENRIVAIYQNARLSRIQRAM